MTSLEDLEAELSRLSAAEKARIVHMPALQVAHHVVVRGRSSRRDRQRDPRERGPSAAMKVDVGLTGGGGV